MLLWSCEPVHRLGRGTSGERTRAGHLICDSLYPNPWPVLLWSCEPVPLVVCGTSGERTRAERWNCKPPKP